jgi:hypothetical protein
MRLSKQRERERKAERKHAKGKIKAEKMYMKSSVANKRISC